jgi:predicted nucleotidyltransferase
MNQIITDNLKAIQTICEQFGVARLELFGSAARDDFDPEKSDFDFIVEFLDYGLGISDRFFGLIDALQELLGRSVDLTSARTLSNPYFLDEIEADRITLYGPENRSAAA